MKHNILIINELNKVETVRNFPDSYEALKYLRNLNPAPYYSTTYQIQLNYFEDPALLIDFGDESLTAFRCVDLATILLIKDIAHLYFTDDFGIYYQMDDIRIRSYNPLALFELLLEPLEDSILKRRLTSPLS